MMSHPELRADFYSSVNGEWINTHPIPPDKTAINAFSEVNDTVEEDLKAILEEIAGNAHKAGTITSKIGNFYRTGMDTRAIEQQGITSLEEELGRIDAMATLSDVQALLPRLTLHGIDPLFSIFAHPDPKNSTWMITGV
ncbi:MAG: M13 family metallopeptidase, partial [Methanomicrobiales archaeon]|nr:M13 family metallopeptidase [Methanomicrobiales archaeon]